MPKPLRSQRRQTPHAHTDDTCVPGLVQTCACHHVHRYASCGSTTPFHLCKSPPQGLLLLPALGIIAHDSRDACEMTVRGAEQGYRESDREALAIFAQGRNPQDVSMVARLTCLHNGMIPCP